jgi:hypothetical protein
MRLLSLFHDGRPLDGILHHARALGAAHPPLGAVPWGHAAGVFASDWTQNYPLNSASFFVLFGLQFTFLAQGSRYFSARAMSTLVKELEGRSWNWTRQLPILLRLVNRHSAIFLFILLVGWFIGLKSLRSVGMASVIASVTGICSAVVILAGWPPLLRWLVTAISSDSQAVLGWVLLLVSALVLIRHRSNIQQYYQRSSKEEKR